MSENHIIHDSSQRNISEAFSEIVFLAERLGIESISALPGCWEYQIDKRWWMAVNGHKEAVECSFGVKVPPFNVYLQFNGWPAGVINPFGGVIAAGDAANEDTFIAALKLAGP